MTARTDPVQQQPPPENPQPHAAHRRASAWRRWSTKRQALTGIGAAVVLAGTAAGGAALAISGHTHPERNNPRDVTLQEPAWLTTRNGIASATCAAPASIRAWGQDPNTVADIYYRCKGQDGGQVYIRIFGSSGAEELFADRVSGYVTGSEQIVVGDLWAISTDDEAALTASLDVGGHLL